MEPPLSPDGQPAEAIDRRHFPVHWLAAIVLTTFCGAALMAAAVFASLNSSANIASHPQEIVLRGLLGLGASHREDRLPLPEASTYRRRVIRISTVTRANNRGFVHVQPLVRLFGDLPLNRSALLDRIPRFNPERLLAESAPGGNAPPQAEPNDEVSFVMRDLSKLLPKLKIRLVTPPPEIMARIRKSAARAANSAHGLSGLADLSGIELTYAHSAEYPFLGTRIVPENVTQLPKTTDKTAGGIPFNRRTVVVKKGEDVVDILHHVDAKATAIAAIDRLLGRYGDKHGVKAGDALRILFTPAGKNRKAKPVRVIVSDKSGPEAVVALSDSGKYVTVDPNLVDNATVERTDEDAATPQSAADISLYQSFYETALRHHLPKAIIDNFLRIYAFDVDLERRVEPGDTFSLLYATSKQGVLVPNKDDAILFASLTANGHTKDLYRFRSPRTNTVDYYDRHGESAKTFLLRKPLPVGRLSSGFGWRKHPILGVELMHKGVDWAAPIGTPVYAAGEGIIEREGWESGYGKFMLLRHAYGYETAYAHLSGYARGTHVGEHVKQGQVIAFVGSTGLSTGPHLNFEFRINGHFVDPLRVKLPHEHVLRGAVLAHFGRQRQRIDQIMSPMPSQVASRS